MGCVRVLGNPSTPQPVHHVFGHVSPGKTPCFDGISIQLIQRIQSQNLNSGELVKALRRNLGMNLLLCSLRAFIAITKRVADRLSLRSQTHIVNGPAIDTNRDNSFWRMLSARSDARFYTTKDGGNVPSKTAPLATHRVGETVYQVDLGLTFDPAQQRDATVFRTQIDCDKNGLPLAGIAIVPGVVAGPDMPFVRNCIHRRKASVSPPSTGMIWPVVQCDFGPARKSIAFAQSLGSIGRCIRLRFA